MPHVQYWARVRAGMDCPLRRGAWYRVVELTPEETVLEVNSRLLRIPRKFLQILPLRPPMWSLVRRRPDDAPPAAAAPCTRSPGPIRRGGHSKCCRVGRYPERWRAPARSRCARSPRRSACGREGQKGKDASQRLAVTLPV